MDDGPTGHSYPSTPIPDLIRIMGQGNSIKSGECMHLFVEKVTGIVLNNEGKTYREIYSDLRNSLSQFSAIKESLTAARKTYLLKKSLCEERGQREARITKIQERIYQIKSEDKVIDILINELFNLKKILIDEITGLEFLTYGLKIKIIKEINKVSIPDSINNITKQSTSQIAGELASARLILRFDKDDKEKLKKALNACLNLFKPFEFEEGDSYILEEIYESLDETGENSIDALLREIGNLEPGIEKRKIEILLEKEIMRRIEFLEKKANEQDEKPKGKGFKGAFNKGGRSIFDGI